MKPTAKLDRRTLEKLGRFLEAQRAELKKVLQGALTERAESEPGRSSDFAAWATETLHDEVKASVMDLRSGQVAQIEAALERLRCGEYGICQDCGQFIGLARLRALPFAERCRPCQSHAETEARRSTGPVTTAFNEG